MSTEKDAAGCTVYFRTASYVDEADNLEITNASMRRSLHVDVDVKDKKGYPSPATAAQEITRVIKELSLPEPLIVMSGGGFHLYWLLDADVTISEWQPVADQLKATLKAAGLKFDAGLTGNPVCLLRPLGTHNRKKLAPTPVKLLRSGVPTSLAALASLLGDDLSQPASDLSSPFAVTDDLIVKTDYAPSDADAVANHCAFVREFRDTGFGGGGLQSEWYDALGAIHNCINGEEKAHEFSAVADNYVPGAVTNKLKQLADKSIAAITCKHVNDNYDYCAGCPHLGQITAPIQLGEKQAELQALQSLGTEVDGPWWPKRTGWDEAAQEMFVELWNPDEAEWERHYFCSSKFYVETRIWSDDDTWAFRVRRLKYTRATGEEIWESFTVPTSFVARPTDMAAEFAKQEVYMNTSKDNTRLTGLLRSYGDVLRNRQVETVMHSAMGWYAEDAEVPRTNVAYPPQAKGFILGNKLITVDGEKEILLSDNVPSNWRNGFDVMGTPAVWARGIHEMFVESNQHAYQFIIASEFAAPLVSLMGREEYHGNPISIVGESGMGKSTVCKLAVSIWGDPAKLTINGNPSNGVTAKAFQKKLSNLSNISPLLDEVSKQSSAVLGELIYVVAMGQGRDKLNQFGKPMDIEDPWYSLTKFTSNRPVMEIVTEDERDTEDTGDAIQKRLFEVNFSRLGYTRDVLAKDAQLGLKMQELLNTQYGTVGRIWIRYILNNIDTLVGDLQTEYALVKSWARDHSAERFHDYMEACVIVACRHLHKSGVMRPQVEGVRNFIHDVRADMTDMRSSSKLPMEDAFARYLASNQGGLLITEKFPEPKKGRPDAPEYPKKDVHGEVVGRIAVKAGRAALAIMPLRNWCKHRGVEFGRMISELDRQGYFVHDPEELKKATRPDALTTAAVRMNLTTGTTLHGSREKCLVLDYGRISTQGHLRVVNQPAEDESNDQSGN